MQAGIERCLGASPQLRKTNLMSSFGIRRKSVASSIIRFVRIELIYGAGSRGNTRFWVRRRYKGLFLCTAGTIPSKLEDTFGL